MSQIIQKRIELAVKARFPEDGSISRNALTQAELPPGLGHFLLKTLDRRIRRISEQLLLEDQEWIDSRHPSTTEAVSHLSSLLQAAGQFPVDEWDTAVSEAVETQLAYLQEPARALADFAFATESTTLPASDLRHRSGFFSDYPYMGKAVNAWLEQRDEQHIDRNAFQSAMRHLDCRLTEDYSEEQWIRLLQPLVDTMHFAGVQPAGLPVGMTIRFFEAKDRPVIASLIRSAARVHRAEMITLPSLRDIIQKAVENERLQAEGGTLFSDQAQPADDGEGDRTSEQAEEADDGNEAPQEQPLPLWKRFQQRVEGPTASQGLQPTESGAQPLWKSFENPARSTGENSSSLPASEALPSSSHPDPYEPEPPASPSTVEEAPSSFDRDKTYSIADPPRLEAQHIVLGTAVRSRDLFIRDLFDGDEDMFTDVMEQLAEAPDWTLASSIIADRIFRPYRVDIYSEIAVDFTNAVEARYSGISS